MKNEKLSSEQKSHPTKKGQQAIVMQRILIDMIIHESILKRRKRQLEKQIDHALDMKNKELFMKLSNEMKQLIKCFGT